MFRGITEVNLDDKGRVALPKRYRPSISSCCQNNLVVTIDTEEPCLLLYPLPDWEQIEQKLHKLPTFNKNARRLQRLLLGHAQELTMDQQGRILLSPTLRNYIKASKELVLVGQGKKFEIWDLATWEQMRSSWLDEHNHENEEIPELVKNLVL